MSQENVEIVRAVYEHWSEGDFRAAVDLFDPHVVLVLRPEFGPDFFKDGTYVGPEGIATYTRDLLKPWERLTMEAEELLAVGDSVLASVHQRGFLGTSGGVPTELRFFTLWTFRGPSVIRIESFRERADALEAAGLRH